MTDLSDAERWALYARWLEAEDAAVRANAIICLIHQDQNQQPLQSGRHLQPL